ncbi:hypothetical protein Ae717Ps2_7201c [Pseudonocardia sp. Ae717_Ps2]|uniref:hypothetical protein n=1 Tax=Pseudonocardia sp. Ae717_Ps2 TaxID=1885573 RepID=UPI00094B648D|nr:hypothetical protein [Pseudonocardia sp. Ae717_Ps2]OLM27692.1 hypothetical protein Ae717Ps2_7201c [Pseudonocardia sp. Ae717_Ps2]
MRGERPAGFGGGAGGGDGVTGASGAGGAPGVVGLLLRLGGWGWAQVIAIGLLSKGWVRFELRHLDGRRGLVEASPSHPTSCLTASTARRVGITG